MKKSILVLMLGLAICAAGCGKEGAEETPVSQTIEEVSTKAGEEAAINIEDLDAYIASVKEQADIIETSLENDPLTQMDMDVKSQELLKIWDNALNYLWGELKNSQSEEEFSKLLDEQRAWIEEKEKAVEEAGKEMEGGSLYTLVVNLEAASITEERVYELYELLK